MNDIQLHTVGLVAGTTNSIIDRHRCLAALAYGKQQGIEDEVRAYVLKGRRNYLNYLTVTQREWQSKTRRHSRARFHDSIAIRDKYVRC